MGGNRHRAGWDGVRQDVGVERLGQRADLPDVGDAPGDADVGTDEFTPGRSTYSANSQMLVLRSPAATGTPTLAANARKAATLSGGIGSSTNSGR